jgi:hypothetical protein
MVHDLLKMSIDTKIHKFHVRDPLPTLAKGRAVIMGDAAGPHLPQHAQGGTISLECGAALGILFSDLPRGIKQDPGALASAVQERTAMFSEIMRYRLALTQLMSYCIPFNPQDEFMVRCREKLAALWAEDGISLPPPDYPPFGPDITEVLYRHNVIEKTKRSMEERGLQVPA